MLSRAERQGAGLTTLLTPAVPSRAGRQTFRVGPGSPPPYAGSSATTGPEDPGVDAQTGQPGHDPGAPRHATTGYNRLLAHSLNWLELRE